MQATLSHYRILEQIGSGGMGVVYRAHDEHLDCDVALKVFRAGELTDDCARKRFRREALALSKLNHPNIAVVHDFDTQDGTDFLVEELIPGLSLEEMLATGPLSEKEIVNLASQLCKGLAAAHEQGIIHRDLKPGNIRIRPDARVKILDFGLARVLRTAGAGSDGDTTASFTETAQVSGTLPYMAPEQLLNQKLDARTDLWAVGCVLYEMATGRRPFLGSGPALIDAILHQQPAAPAKLNHDLSPGLEAIILKCLQKDPASRYGSAREVGADVRRLGAGSVTKALAARRRRTAVKFAAVAMVLVAICGAAAWFIRAPRKPAANAIRSLAVLPLANLSGDPGQEYFADGMTESLITDLGRLTGLKSVIARGSVMRYKGTRKPLAEIARELKVDALITGSVLRSGNRLRITAQLIHPETGEQLWTENYERNVSDILRLQSDVTRAIAAEIRVKLTSNEQAALSSGRSLNPRAYDAYLMGRFHSYKATPQGLDRSLEYYQLALQEDPDYAPAYAGIGYAWALRGHTGLSPTQDAYVHAKAAAEKALELDNTLPEAHDSLASVLFAYEWDWAAAEREYRRAIELNPNYANARCFYSFFLYAMRRPQEAKAQIERALELDPYNAFFHAALAMQLPPDEALVRLQTAATLEPDSLFTHNQLWGLFQQRNEHDKALAEAKEVYTLLGAPDVVEALERGYSHGGYALAMRRGADVLAQRAKRTSVRPTDIARMYARGGEKDRALDWLEKAYRERSSMLIYLNVNAAHFDFDSLRSEPRFLEILRQMKFPP